MYIERLASQIMNDILSGLRGYHQNLSLNLQQLEDEVVQTRMLVIKQQIANGMINLKDLLVAINCIDVDCAGIERCKCGSTTECETLQAHFQIPQLLWDLGQSALDYVGSVDRMQRFNVVTSLSEMQMRKYRKRGKDKPYIWIDFAPNSEGMLDCFVFNAPLLEQISVVGIFKDPRQVEKFSCCTDADFTNDGPDLNLSCIDQLVKETLTDTKIKYYRQLAAQVQPNDQQYKTGN